MQKRSSFARTQDRVIRLLGNGVEGRADLVARLLHRDPSEATSYWLQLLVAVGIATLGLVLASTAVVIGAMLVAPLMGPIVGLAMGLASGSPFLVLRSAGRIGLSVVVATLGAAAITLSLPFHELNAEISSRASPTILDLAIACFCAIAGVYASLRPGSDTAATAAGTSISISLVPPLCASGYGIGTGAWSIAGGAALLFLTNLVAIALVGTVTFAAAGFGRVDVVALERAELTAGDQDSPIARWLAKRLSSVFASGAGPALRLSMPFLLLAAVYVPLRRALDEVAWEVRVRAAVRHSITAEQPRVVQSRLHVERHQVHLVLVLLGTAKEIEKVRARLDGAIREAAGVAPHLEVLAVPDAAAFAGLESTLLTPKSIERPRTEAPSDVEQLEHAQTLVRTTVTRLWPATTAGAALDVEVSTSNDDPLRVRVIHVGAPLQPDAAEALERALAGELGRPSLVVDVPVPPGELTPGPSDLEFVAQVTAGVRATTAVDGLSVCVTRPAEPGSSPHALELNRLLDRAFAAHPRVVTQLGEQWRVRFEPGECSSRQTAATGSTAPSAAPP